MTVAKRRADWAHQPPPINIFCVYADDDDPTYLPTVSANPANVAVGGDWTRVQSGGAVANLTLQQFVSPYALHWNEDTLWLRSGLAHGSFALSQALLDASWPLYVGEARSAGERAAATRRADEEVQSTGWNTLVDDIVRELGRLPADWAGPGTVAPTATTLRAIEQVSGYLPSSTTRPLVEVDEENGHVTLSWMSADRRHMFSLLFPGCNEVIGSYSSLDPGASQRPWKYKINEEAKIVAAIENEQIRAVLVAK